MLLCVKLEVGFTFALRIAVELSSLKPAKGSK